ncbi:enoyl-CoA hydratase/isomerase family protein [Phenylobacterium sp. SCN 70-31]|uniref:enoyl-CoA hydratase/isomerase family protein n=1 Tax=Phenylobacterium sp. SCN 70-31 TaxID=1660129 RepID=UPI00086A793A|nr:enoyl-CoA hydratase/isomerase family protein [Phenylobacterium sp. SCN 70-31]ODT88534.1 MAG: enoyl-CoA hydratase [Phenylobacterium sp. SCN 70-31]
MPYETILVEVADGVATVTLNRPRQMNSFNRVMAQEFRQLWESVREDPEIRAIVLRSAGGRAFSTGVDVKEGWRAPGAREMPFEMDDPGEWLGPKSNKVWKPMIVAVSGMAAGGAFYWLNEADIIICSEDATFFDPHVTFGMVSAVEPVGAMARIPLSEIQRMVLLGNHERISAQTALRISLVTEITSSDDLWARAAELAGLIADKHPVAIQGTVRAIWESQGVPRTIAVANALKYTQIGNPISTAAIDRSSMTTPDWSLR